MGGTALPICLSAWVRVPTKVKLRGKVCRQANSRIVKGRRPDGWQFFSPPLVVIRLLTGPCSRTGRGAYGKAPAYDADRRQGLVSLYKI